MDVSFTPLLQSQAVSCRGCAFPAHSYSGPASMSLPQTNGVQRQSKEGRTNHLVLSLGGKEDVKTLGLTKGIL